MNTLALSAAAILISYTARADDAVGRFQLVTATVHVVPALDSKMLFKIDTVTGRTWWYLSGESKNGKTFDRWIEIED